MISSMHVSAKLTYVLVFLLHFIKTQLLSVLFTYLLKYIWICFHIQYMVRSFLVTAVQWVLSWYISLFLVFFYLDKCKRGLVCIFKCEVYTLYVFILKFLCQRGIFFFLSLMKSWLNVLLSVTLQKLWFFLDKTGSTINNSFFEFEEGKRGKAV